MSDSSLEFVAGDDDNRSMYKTLIPAAAALLVIVALFVAVVGGTASMPKPDHGCVAPVSYGHVSAVCR